MDEKKIKRLNKFSKVGFWLVLVFFIFQALAYPLEFAIWEYLKIQNLIPADCSNQGLLNTFLNLFDGISSQLSIFLLSFFVSFLGFLISLFIFFLSAKETISRGRAKNAIILFVFVSLIFLWVYSSYLTAYPKQYMSSSIALFKDIRNDAEIYFDENGTYGPSTNNCNETNTIFTDSDIAEKIKILRKDGRLGEVVCRSTKDSYIISAELFGGEPICKTRKLVCIDSSINFKTDLKELPEGLTCPNHDD